MRNLFTFILAAMLASACGGIEPLQNFEEPSNTAVVDVGVDVVQAVAIFDKGLRQGDVGASLHPVFRRHLEAREKFQRLGMEGFSRDLWENISTEYPDIKGSEIEISDWFADFDTSANGFVSKGDNTVYVDVAIGGRTFAQWNFGYVGGELLWLGHFSDANAVNLEYYRIDSWYSGSGRLITSPMACCYPNLYSALVYSTGTPVDYVLGEDACGWFAGADFTGYNGDGSRTYMSCDWNFTGADIYLSSQGNWNCRQHC